MASPFRLPLTLLFAGATALSATALSAAEAAYNGALYDPLYDSQWQWNPEKNGIEISSAWMNGYMGSGVIIGIVDEWLDPEHPDLQGNYNAEWSKDFVGTASDADEVKYDGETHGTFVAGMAAAVGQNNIGIIGAAPKAQLAGLHVDLSDAQVIQAYYWGSGINAETGAVEGDAAIHIKNCSFGYPPYFVFQSGEDYLASVEKTSRNNTIYVIASGNSRSKTSENYKTTPADANGDATANFEGGIVVGSTSQGGYYSGFSCYGANLFVTAPGESVFSTSRPGLTMTADDEGGDADGEEDASLSIRADDGGNENRNNSDRTAYTYSSGTSFSTPIVSGVIALAAEKNAAMDARWAKHAIARSCDILDTMRDKSLSKGTVWTTNSAGLEFSNDYGFGLINAPQFIEVAENIAYETIRTSSSVTAKINGNRDAWTKNSAISAVATVDLEQPVESVEVTFTIDDINYFQDAKVVLVSPTGTESVLLDKAWLSDKEEDNAYEEVYNLVTQEKGSTALSWTFVSNAFWGVKEEGDWTVKFINSGTGTAKVVGDVSLKFNTGTVVMEHADMVIDSGLDVHALVIDHASTNCSVSGFAGVLRVEDSVIVNGGTLNVDNGGKITTYDEDWKGLKVRLSGGTINLNKSGTIEASRGFDVSGGVLNLNGGSISGEGGLNISGGQVNVKNASSKVSRVDLSGTGVLTTNPDGSLAVSSFNMSGGTFNMGGKNALSLDASGGSINVTADGTEIQSMKVGAAATTAASLNVPSGTSLYVGTVLNGIGILEIAGYYEAAESIDGEEPKPEIVMSAKANIGGRISAGMVKASRAQVYASGASFTCDVDLSQKSVLVLDGDMTIEGKGGLSLRDSEFYAGKEAVLKLTQAGLSLSDGSYLQIGGGTGDGTMTVEAGVDLGLACYDSRIGLVFGDEININKTVEIRGESVVELSFQNKLPRDTIEFINSNEGVVVDDTVSVAIDANAPTVWDGKEEIPLVYNINTNGTIEAALPDTAVLVPVRLTYSQMTAEQKAISQSLRTCLSDGENKGVSSELIGELNKFEYLDSLLGAYDQLLPVNLITINTLNNKQAAAVTGTFERRARELRSGYPVSDLWSVPLFNSYGFSFSANPNAVAANGMRQFVGYDLNDTRAMLWANGGYSFSDGDATSHTAKTKTDMLNASIGFDYAVNDRLSLGLFAMYSSGTTEMKATGSETEAAMRSLGVYFAGSRNDKEGSFYYMGMASYGVGEYDFTRTTQIGNYNSKATATPDGSQAIGYLAAGWEWDAGSQALSYQWTTGPMVSLRYTYNSVDGYTENGNGADTLKVDDYSYDSLVTSVGWRSTVRFNVKETITFVPEARISWQHEFLDGDDKIDAALALPGATPFSTTMNKEGSDYVTAGVGVTVLIAEATTISLDYDLNFLREDSDPEHNINLMMRCRF